MDPSLVMFAIESAVRLGNKLNEVLVDKVHERPLVLPLGDSYADVTEIKAVRFFDQPENIHLVLEGGPYFGFDNEELKKAYRTLLEIDERLDAKGSTLSKARNTVEDLYRFEQFKEGLGADSPAQKLLGTIVNIGIDYFSRYPQALGEQNNGRKVVQAFVSRLDVEMIAEGTPRAAVGHVLLSALHVLDDRVSLVDDDERLQVLLSGVTQAVIGEVEEAGSAGETDRRQDLFKRIGRSILRGGVTTFTENAGLFFRGDDEAKLVESTLRQTLAGLRDHESLFSSESVEVIFGSALRTVGENARLFTGENVLQELIASTTEVLASRDIEDIISRESAASILIAGLDVTAENVESMIGTDGARKQLLASSVSALAQGLSDDLAGSARFRDLLSRRQLVELSSIAFEAVARQPDQLLGDDLTESRRSTLSQVIGSVAAALGEDPGRLVNGEGVVEILQLALHTSIRNADKLLDLDTDDPKTNLLYRLIGELARGVAEAEDPRRLLGREVFLEMVESALPVVSAHVGPLVSDQKPIVKLTVEKSLCI